MHSFVNSDPKYIVDSKYWIISLATKKTNQGDEAKIFIEGENYDSSEGTSSFAAEYAVVCQRTQNESVIKVCYSEKSQIKTTDLLTNSEVKSWSIRHDRAKHLIAAILKEKSNYVSEDKEENDSRFYIDKNNLSAKRWCEDVLNTILIPTKSYRNYFTFISAPSEEWEQKFKKLNEQIVQKEIPVINHTKVNPNTFWQSKKFAAVAAASVAVSSLVLAYNLL